MRSLHAQRCRHIKVNGTQCGSPALRKKNFCFYHQQTRPLLVECFYKPDEYATGEIHLPVFEDAHSIQSVIREVMQMVMQKRLDQKTASVMLYALQIASSNLKRMQHELPQPEESPLNVEINPETRSAIASTEPDEQDTESRPQIGETLVPGTIHACASDWGTHFGEGETTGAAESEIANSEEKQILRSSKNRFARRTDVLKPAADVNLRVRLTAEVASRRTVRGLQLPSQHGKFFFSAFDHKPMRWMITDNTANLTLKFP
jgi:hypothetical protein